MGAGNFQIRIWTLIEKKKLDSKSINMVGECYVYLKDLLKMEAVQVNTDNRVTKTVDLKKVLWNEGKKVGELQAVVVLKYLSFQQQLFAGVMTEKGLKRSAPLIVDMGEGSRNNQNVVDLGESLLRLSQMNNEGVGKGESDKRAVGENNKYKGFKLKDALDQIKTLLLKSEKKSSVSFVYSSVIELTKAQELFLDVWQTLWMKFDSVEGEIEATYCQCFEAILKRGEFDLQNVSLDENDKQNLDFKAKIGSRFFHLIVETLSHVFDELLNSAITNSKRNFIEFFLAYCYFRLPSFRNELLQVLSENQTQETKSSDDKMVKTVLFGWNEEFLEPLLRLSQQGRNSAVKLSEALEKNWKLKFKSRGIIFFYFVKEWCSYVNKTIIVNHVEWEDIVGYNVILSTFVSQMKSRRVAKYPDVLLECSESLLQNNKLLKPFFYAVLEKTK